MDEDLLDKARAAWAERARERGLAALGDAERATLPPLLPRELRGRTLLAANLPPPGPDGRLAPCPLEVLVPEEPEADAAAKLASGEAVQLRGVPVQFLKILEGSGPVAVLQVGDRWHLEHDGVRHSRPAGSLADLADRFDPRVVLQIMSQDVVPTLTALNPHRLRSWRQVRASGDPEQLADLWHQLLCRPVGTLGRGVNEIWMWRSVASQLRAMAEALLCGCVPASQEEVARAAGEQPHDACTRILHLLEAAQRCLVPRKKLRDQARELSKPASGSRT